jgi:hypothetical protein
VFLGPTSTKRGEKTQFCIILYRFFSLPGPKIGIPPPFPNYRLAGLLLHSGIKERERERTRASAFRPSPIRETPIKEDRQIFLSVGRKRERVRKESGCAKVKKVFLRSLAWSAA